MKNRLYLFGMFRSGSTLLSRMLNSHPEIHLASEPYRPFYKMLRNVVATRNKIDIQLYDPFHSYFADSGSYSIFQKIQDLRTLDMPFPSDQSKRLIQEIRDHHHNTGDPVDEPDIMEGLDCISETEGSFRDINDRLFKLIEEVYGESAYHWIGTKETWITEFSPVLSNVYPESRFIYCIRDPRAVVASSNRAYPKKPLLFLVRQWRKLTMLSWYYKHQTQFGDRVYIVQFENLIRKPEQTARKLCDFLGLTFNQNMIDPSGFTNTRGDKWRQNTSFKEKGNGFDSSAIDRWRSTLKEQEIRFIEELLFEELKLFDYKLHFDNSDKISSASILKSPKVPVKDQPQWVVDHMNWETPVQRVNDLAKELIRKHLLTAEEREVQKLKEDVIKGYFLYSSIFRVLRSINVDIRLEQAAE